MSLSLGLDLDGLSSVIGYGTYVSIFVGWIKTTSLGLCMANCYHHALSSVNKFGGKIEDYIKIHLWFDESKSHFADLRHRALRHHSFGIWQSEQVFGLTITNSDGKVIPVRFIGEQHVTEDLGFIPCVSDWLKTIHTEPWMLKGYKLDTETKQATHVVKINDHTTRG